MIKAILAGTAVVILSSSAAMVQAEGTDWTSEVELGLVVTSGNTEEENLKLRGDSVAELDKFRHHGHVDSLRSSKDGTTTAQKLYLSFQSDYKLSEIHSVFGRISYDDDKFSGFKYQSDITLGYARDLFETETQKLDASAGVGVRVSELELGGREEEAMVRLAGKYVWQLSDNASFQQLLSTEIGDESTITRSDSSIKANINGSLSMKLALTVKHNSDVPVGREKTDTETSVTLVYGF